MDKLNEVQIFKTGSTIANGGQLTDVAVNKYKTAIDGLNLSQAQAALSTTALNEAQQKQILTAAGLITSTDSVTASEVKQAVSENVLTTAKQQEVLAIFEQQMAEGQLSVERLQAIALENTEAGAVAKVILAKKGENVQNLKNIASGKALNAVLKEQFLLLLKNPLTWVAVAVVGVVALTKAIENSIVTEEKLNEEIEELNSNWSELSSTIQNSAQSFQSLKKSADELIPRYAELAQGVDKYGNNVSLTDEDFEEFVSLNNQLGQMFPELVMGYDSNGNAILSLSGNVNTLTESLYSLVEAQRLASAQTIADTMPDVMSNIDSTVDAYNSRIQLIEEEKKSLEELYNTFQNGGFVEEWSSVGESMVSAVKILDKYGIDYNSEITGERNGVVGSTRYKITVDWDDFETAYNGKIAGFEKQIDDFGDRIEAKWKQLNPVVSAWLSTDYLYQDLESNGQSLVTSMVNAIDFKSLGLTTEQEVQNYITNSIISPIYDMDTATQNAFFKIFDLHEALDNGELSVQEYQEKVNEILENGKYSQEFVSIFRMAFAEDNVQTKYNATLDRFKDEETQSLDELKTKYQEAIDKRKELYSGENYVGNVDINNRPVVINDDGSYSTIFTSFQEKWIGDEETGSYKIIHYTPILPDGTILEDNALNEYIDKILSASDSLEADNPANGGYGIVYKVDTEVNGQKITDDNLDTAFGIADAWDVEMHETQDRMYRDEAEFKAAIERFGSDSSVDLEKFFTDNSINTEEEIDYFNKVTEGAKTASEAIEMYEEAKKQASSSTLSLSESQRESLETYTKQLELITKLRDEWDKATTADERMDLLSSISEQFSNFDLSGLKSGEQSIEDALADLGQTALKTIQSKISDFDEELLTMLAEAFGEVNITPYVRKVEKYRNLLSEVQSGKVYNFDEISAFIAENEDLADSIKVVTDGYQLEEDAVIKLLNSSITAYNEQVSSARITTTDIIKYRQKLIEAYGIEAEALETITKLQTSGNSLDLLTDDDLRYNYGLTAEQIEYVNKYVDLVETLRLKYSELYETMDESSSSSKNEIDWLSNSVENLQSNIDRLQDKLENTKGFDEQLTVLGELNSALGELRNTYYSLTDNSDTIYGEYQNRYAEALGKLGSDAANIKAKIEAGDVFDLQNFKSDTAEIINDAIDAWNGMRDSYDKYIALGIEIDDNKLQEYEIKRKPYEATVPRLEGNKQSIENQIDLNGGQGTVNQYKELISLEEEIQKSLSNRLSMEKEILSTLEPNTDEYVEQEEIVRDIENDLDECVKNTKEWGQELLELPLREIENILDDLSAKLDSVNSELDDMDIIIAGAQAYIQDEIDLQEELKKPIQEQLDALQDANDERERALALEKARYELDRLKNQLSVKLYSGENKGFIYTVDEEAIRDARENIEQLEYEEAINQLEKQLEYYDDIIADLEEIMDKWGNIAQEAEDYYNIQKALDAIGAEGIFNTDVIEEYTKQYTTLTNQKYNFEDQISSWEEYQKAIEEAVTQYEYGFTTFEECYAKIAELTADFYNTIDTDGKASAEKISEIVNNILSEFGLIDIGEVTERVSNDVTEAENEVAEATESMGDAIENVQDTLSQSADETTQVLKSETQEQLEIMQSFADNMTETFQNMCNNMVTSAVNSFQILSEQIATMTSSIQSQIDNIISSSQQGISELQSQLDTANALANSVQTAIASTGGTHGGSGKSMDDVASGLLIGIANSTPKFAKGGIVGNDDESPLDFLAKKVGEDKTVFVRDSEIVLTPVQQNELADKFATLTNNIVPIMPNISVPNVNIPNITKLNNSTPVVQEINLTLPNVTNEHGYNNLIKELKGLPLKAIQYANKR